MKLSSDWEEVCLRCSSEAGGRNSEFTSVLRTELLSGSCEQMNHFFLVQLRLAETLGGFELPRQDCFSEDV